MAKDSRHTSLHAEEGDQKWQRSSGIPRQVRVQTGHHSFVLSLPAEKLPKSMATCAVMTVICLSGDGVGEDRNTMPEIKTGLCWLQRCHDGWTGGADGPPRLLVALAPWGHRKWQRHAEVKSHWLIQTLSQVAFHSAVAVPASAAQTFWWHLMEKGILSLYKNGLDFL